MSKRITIDEVQCIAKSRNHNVVSMEGYKYVKSKVKFFCFTCNNEFETTLASYKNSPKTGCPHCKKKVISELHKDKIVSEETRKILSEKATGRKGSLLGVYGKDHPAFKGAHYRDFHCPSTEYYIWRESVRKRCGRVCFVTGSKKDLVVHHLYGWNLYPDLRFDNANGIVITKQVHKQFHGIYGYGNNTREQFIEFLQEQYNMAISSQALGTPKEGSEVTGGVQSP
jgi:DNA-directed RNA polymerase subunit RPC12/RpoP